MGDDEIKEAQREVDELTGSKAKDSDAPPEEHRPELPSLDDGEGGPAPLGILFAAAAVGLFVLLFVIGLVAYFALGRAPSPEPSNATALLSAPPSGQL